MSWLLILAGCPGTDAWGPDETWHNGEVAEPYVLMEGLQYPRGLAAWDNGLALADAGTGQVLSVSEGTVTVLAEELEEPWALVRWGEDLLVGERGGGRVMRLTAAGDLEVVAEGMTTPGRLAASGERACWLDEAGSLGCSNWEGETLSIEAPLGLALDGETAWVTSSSGLVEVDLGTRESELLVAPVETPQDVWMGSGQLALSTRSTRWPYGGWIYVVDGAEAVGTSHSPPEPLWLAGDDDFIYWSSKQSITRVAWEGGAYENVAMRTAVGDLVVDGDLGLVWTDRERGLLLQASD